MKYSDISVTPLKGNKYKVIKKIVYKDIVVPAGYRTDGANIPRILWSFVPPNKSDLLPAVIIHDYICDQRQYKKADNYFEDVLKSLSVNKTLIKILVTGVRVWHKVAYTEDNQDRAWFKLLKHIRKIMINMFR